MKITPAEIEVIRQEVQLKAVTTTFVNLPAATVLAILDVLDEERGALEDVEGHRREIERLQEKLDAYAEQIEDLELEVDNLVAQIEDAA